MNPTLTSTSCQTLVDHILDELANCGVIDICLCPGSRNALFVKALESDYRFQLHNWPEERSAAFYALGRIRLSKSPAAIITTSGSAAGELLPAMMEAHYAALPLVAVTTDRPRRYRSTGAPQCAEQEGLFGPYAHISYDLSSGESCHLTSLWSQEGPAHLNICLEDPKGSGILQEEPSWRIIPEVHGIHYLSQFLERAQRPLIIVGALQPTTRAAVIKFLINAQLPAILESPSGIREEPTLKHLRLHITDQLWQRAEKHNYPIDAVLRIGGIPTLRPWRDLEDRQSHCALLSIDRAPFPGSCRGELICGSIDKIFNAIKPQKRPLPKTLLDADHARSLQQIELFKSLPTAEPSLFHALSHLIPMHSLICLGNSLPIREWDMAATYDRSHPNIAVQRGVNGIDGQLSSFLGMCPPNEPSWGIFGDLTALYDMAAPWILGQQPNLRPIFVIINNGGGQIFSRLFNEKLFLNEHALSFRPFAEMWNLDYNLWHTIPDMLPDDFASQKPLLIEIRPDSSATALFWHQNNF